ncbi:signal recognition particle-docking protein FtsY [candidate division WOR-3 bacterium]|nr:signal recognition particle-docking protein FtsY [candidate division WOR-3 bacterium]
MNFWEKITKSVSQKSASLTLGLKKLVGSEGKIDGKKLTELEELLILSDMGPELAERLIQIARSAPEGEIVNRVRRELIQIIDIPYKKTDSCGLQVIMMIGVNGTGKTTSAAKLGRLYAMEGKKVIFAAADTYRAAGVLQLQIWAQKLGIDCVGGQEGGDSAAVVHDALESALSRKKDILIIDTAGRLHTKVNLMNELSKIFKVLKKIDPAYPCENLIVMDSTTGQNSISQARTFSEFVPLTGIVLTKYDGTAKGGCVFPIVEKLNIPVKYIGVGENEEDFTRFDAEKFVGSILS